MSLETTCGGKKAVLLAGPGRGKLLLYAVPWALMGLPLLICGPWMAVASLDVPADRIVVYLGGVLALIGWVLTGFMACRLRAAFDERIRLVAGPGGARVSFPSAPLPQRLFLTYRIKNFEMRADEVAKVYPRELRVNGIAIGSEAVISGPGWSLRVDSMFFGASAETLSESLVSALRG
jgi:hypothetical protein